MIGRVAALVVLIACGPTTAPGPTPSPTKPDAAGERPPAEPRRTAELDALFGEQLPQWIVDLNQPEAAGDPVALREAAKTLLDDTRAAAFDAVLDGARRARDVPEAELDGASDRLDDAVAELDRLLAAADLGYVIDATVASAGGARQVLLFSFAVNRARRYRSGEQAYRALWVTRLDRLAYRYNVVGLAAHRRDALILTARIDEWLVRELLPMLETPSAWSAAEEAGELAGAAAAAVRRDLAELAGAGLDDLVAALDERRRLFESIADRLEDRGVSVERPTTLTLDSQWRAALEAGLSAGEREQLDGIERRLSGLDAKLAYTRVRELAIASVEHHEVQHQIDAPAALGGDRPAHERVALRERSAYLAQVARQPAGARLSLVKLAGLALSSRTPPLERQVARRIIADLARQLGAAGGDESTEELAVAAAALVSRDGAALASAAGAIWQRDTGRPLAPLILE